MRKMLGPLWGCLAMFAMPVLADDCSCTAPNGTCSANISCADACWSICGPPCSAGCSGGYGPGGGVRSPTKAFAPLSLELKAVSSEDLAAALSERLGMRVVYVAPETLSLDVSRIGFEELMAVLGKNGVVAALDAPGELSSPKAVAEARFTFRTDVAPASAVAEALSRLSGGVVEFIPTHGDREVSLDLKRVTAADLVQILSGVGRVRVSYLGHPSP